MFVLKAGFEPAQGIPSLTPQASVSTSSTTSAVKITQILSRLLVQQIQQVILHQLES